MHHFLWTHCAAWFDGDLGDSVNDIGFLPSSKHIDFGSLDCDEMLGLSRGLAVCYQTKTLSHQFSTHIVNHFIVIPLGMQ